MQVFIAKSYANFEGSIAVPTIMRPSRLESVVPLVSPSTPTQYFLKFVPTRVHRDLSEGKLGLLLFILESTGAVAMPRKHRFSPFQ